MNRIDLENDIKNGLSTHSISKKYERSQTTISFWLKKFGLKTNFSKIGHGYKNFHGENGKSKYEGIDWELCQSLYNEGCSLKDLKLKGFSLNAIQWALKNKKFYTRNSGESIKLAHKLGKVDNSFRKRESYLKNRIGKIGGYRENSGRCKHIKFTKKDKMTVDLQGTWELRLVEFLDSKNVEWERNRVGFKYSFENKLRNYFPDFYLKKHNLFLEVKGYETEKDREKWKQFPFKLLILKKKEIDNLEIWCNINNI